MRRGNLYWIIHIDRILLTQTRIPCRNLNGFMICIAGILVYPYWRCSVSSSPRKAIPAIRSPYTVYSASLVTHPRPLLPRRLMCRSPMIPPVQIGVKWQMDVKYVPPSCYTGDMPQKFYQYTVIDEASRERFLYPYLEQTSFSTVDFLQRAIRYFATSPKSCKRTMGQSLLILPRRTELIRWMSFARS